MKLLVVDCDYTYDRNNNPVIRLYGKNIDNDENIVLHVLGFEPYIYISSGEFNIFELEKKVNELLKGYIKRIEVVKRFKPLGYQNEKTNMLKVVLFNPRTVPDVRRIAKEKIPEITDSVIYEADILFRDRYCIDNGINGMSVIWFEGKNLENYGVGCNILYICELKDVVVMKDEKILIEY